MLSSVSLFNFSETNKQRAQPTEIIKTENDYYNLDTPFWEGKNNNMSWKILVCRYFCLFCLSDDMNNINKLPYMLTLTPFTSCFAAKGFGVWFGIRKQTCTQVLSSESWKNQFSAVKLYSNTRMGG